MAEGVIFILDKKKKENRRPIPPPDKVKAIIEEPPSKYDTEGWYTGLPVGEDKVPIQDIDDL